MNTNNMTAPSPSRSKNILLLIARILHAPSRAIHILFFNSTTRRKKCLFQAQHALL